MKNLSLSLHINHSMAVLTLNKDRHMLPLQETLLE